jgi:hypothetical protein
MNTENQNTAQELDPWAQIELMHLIAADLHKDGMVETCKDIHILIACLKQELNTVHELKKERDRLTSEISTSRYRLGRARETIELIKKLSTAEVA